MLHFHKFRDELLDPASAQEVYDAPGAGKGWPAQCPPTRSACAFGFDLLANFDVAFTRKRDGTWRAEPDTVIESDFVWSATEDSEGRPLVQQYAWFWDRGQTLPHKISDNVYATIRNQVKISSFLFLKTDPNEILLMTEVPWRPRKWRALTALIEPDWYPASYPWHVMIELDSREKLITIAKGEPLCRIMPLRRDTYFARPMGIHEFDDFFERGQRWLATHGRIEHEQVSDVLNITQTYSRQQAKSRFVVLP